MHGETVKFEKSAHRIFSSTLIADNGVGGGGWGEVGHIYSLETVTSSANEVF